jgi:ribosomal protein L11 methyltransferase
VAEDDAFTVPEGSTTRLAVTDNDFHPGGLFFTIVSWTQGTDGGAVDCTSGFDCLYTTPAGGVTSDAFEYTIEDEFGGQDTATVTITIEPCPELGAAIDVGGIVTGSVARRAVERARRDLGHLQAFGLRPIGELETRLLHEEDWADAWKRHFPVMRVGRRIVIRPTWRRHRRRPGEVVIALDPGMAFGTGLHPTTRLCLAALEDWADAGLLADGQVLDLGCGSGILGICAGLLGAGSVLSLDTDPLAVEATRANTARNRLTGRLEARRGSLPIEPPEQFDVVLANLVASLLIDLASELLAAVRPGGRLLASGIFIDRRAEVGRAFESVGFELSGRRTEGDWVTLEAVRGKA